VVLLSNSKKVAVVTGAAQGIGLKIAERLFEEILDRDLKRLL
jgi:meso-butanediol dehydrogenase/(S,S)-butanediol dehydrogenase/diacetyl reductase